MACIGREPGGYRILFVAPDGKRKTVRLGKVSRRQAEAVKVKIEGLNAAQITGHTPDEEVSRWVANLDTALADKLAAVGLVPTREPAPRETLRAFLDSYIAGRASLKPNTGRNYQVTKKHLLDHFGPEKPLAEICPGDADQWRESLLAGGMSPATLGRELKRARQFFRAAVRRKLIGENPFADVAAPPQVNPAREHFITCEVAQNVLDACPDAEWRLLFALARYGGLRIPSKAVGLRWGDVDWAQGRLTVRSPKTERLPGGQSRVIPLFPELRPHLEEVFERAEPGSVYILPALRKRGAAVNLRTRLERIIYRAGLVPWPRLWQNLRASRETELSQTHPLHVVCQWIGNTARIATAHDLQVTDRDFARALGTGGTESGTPAAQKAAQQPAAPFSSDSQETQQAPEDQGLVLAGASSCDTVQNYTTPPGGVEPPFSD